MLLCSAFIHTIVTTTTMTATVIQNVLAGTFSQELYDFVGAVLLLACPSWW